MFTEKEVKTLRNLFREFRYVMTTAEMHSIGLYYADIQKLLEEGLIEKLRRGYYLWAEPYFTSEAAIISRLFPDAVLCMDTALFHYRYSERTPVAWHITIDKNTSRQRTEIDYPFVQAYRVEPEILPIGESSSKIDGFEVRIYDRDRTICDVLRNVSKMDKEIFNKAIQNYVKDHRKNIPNLMLYAEQLRIQKRVKEWIGVWL